MNETLGENLRNENGLSKPFTKLTEEQKNIELAKMEAAEKKLYIFLLRSDIDEVNQTWLDAIGRSNAYDLAKSLAIAGDVDLTASFILVEGNPLEKSVTVYEFLAGMQRRFNDGFNVDNYVTTAIETANSDLGSTLNPSVEDGTHQIDVTYNPNNTGEDI